MNIKPIEIGARVIVSGITYALSYVANVEYLAQEDRWRIDLFWRGIDGSDLGSSKVYSNDENKIWFRWKDTN